MILGTSYMGLQVPEHLEADLKDIQQNGFDDVVIALSENDFNYMKGKIEYSPDIAHKLGLRIIANFWGFACTFGGGRISKLLTDRPDAWTVDRNGKPHGHGCQNNPVVIDKAREFVRVCVDAGMDGFFWDEPTKFDCYCRHCQDYYKQNFGGDIFEATQEQLTQFRNWGIVHYVQTMSNYVKEIDKNLFTGTCLMPEDKDAWEDVAEIESLDTFGTDPYWTHFVDDPDGYVQEPTREIKRLCSKYGKISHMWLQNGRVPAGREDEVFKAAKLMADEKPDAMYVWAYRGQKGTSESSGNPELAWENALKGFRYIRGMQT